MSSLSKYLFEHLHFGIENKIFTLVEKLIFFLIVLNCITVIIESEQVVYQRYKDYFDISRTIFGVVFTFEYVSRLIAAGQIKQFKGFKGRIKYLFTLWSIIDLIAIAPLFLVGINEGFLLRILRGVRLFSLTRFGRFSAAIHNVTSAVYERRKELMFSFFIAISLLFISSTVLYVFEGEPARGFWKYFKISLVGCCCSYHCRLR